MAREKVPQYGVHEVSFEGPVQGPEDQPAADVVLTTEWSHESGTNYRVHGFWDGDGEGGAEGGVFRVRFCPTRPGKWTLVNTVSNRPQLSGKKEDKTIECTGSDRRGFWEVDDGSPGNRWYRRSDGSREYISGNTVYTFLSERRENGKAEHDIVADVHANAEYFNKIRFLIGNTEFPHPTEKPYFDDDGELTDDGDYSHRPNPGWFHERVDLAVREALEVDLITDLILSSASSIDDWGVGSRVFRAAANDGDPTPFLRYVAARYGSYPNVWLCLANEWDLRYTAAEIRELGTIMASFLPYPTPLSVHAYPGPWDTELNTDPDWNDHVIIQNKRRALWPAKKDIERSHRYGGGDKPVVNDELAYQGDNLEAGHPFTKTEVIEAHLGAFLGGGYGTTGYKPDAPDYGQYKWGDVDTEEHTAAPHLRWLRESIDEHVTFWGMRPVHLKDSVFGGYDLFDGLSSEWWTGVLARPEREYVIGSNTRESLTARLPGGTWTVRQFDVMAMEADILDTNASDEFDFETLASQASFTHFEQ